MNRETINHGHNKGGTIGSTVPTTGIGTTQDTSVPPDNPYRNETDNKEATQDHPHKQDRTHLRLQEERRKDKDSKRMKYEKARLLPQWETNTKMESK